MLAAEAMRLAAVETLCPTACKSTDLGWPTLARHRVYDSKGILPDEVEPDAAYTPCLALYTDDVRIERRGESAPSSIGFVTAVLVVVAELAVADTDEDGTRVAIPKVENDAMARLALGALTAQVRKRLLYAEAGSIFRQIVGAVEDLRVDAFSLPQFDIRWLRSTMRFTCRIKDDKFTDEAGMPEPMRSLYQALPAGSYAKAKLAELDAIFTATARQPLTSIQFSTTGDPAVDGPEGSIP